jgi:hypothetical protein
MQDHIFGMLLKHQKLDEELRLEQARVKPDSVRLQQLKRMKLAIKDRLHRLTSRPQVSRAF